MVIGALDLMEGSLLILPGAGLVALGAMLSKSQHRRYLYSAFALVAVGVSTLWALSAMGGLGGSTGRSLWWGVVLLPYPIGWILSLLGTIRLLRDISSARVRTLPE